MLLILVAGYGAKGQKGLFGPRLYIFMGFGTKSWIVLEWTKWVTWVNFRKNSKVPSFLENCVAIFFKKTSEKALYKGPKSAI